MEKTFLGFQRADGSVGIRNYVLIIPAQGSLRRLSEMICQFVPNTKTTHFPIETGRSKADRNVIGKTFIGLGQNPNVYAVLVLGLDVPVFEEVRAERIRDEISKSGKKVELLVFDEDIGIYNALEKSIKVARNLVLEASNQRKQLCGIEYLSIAVKCGNSDPTSGIAGNPVVGSTFDKIINNGGKAFFSESPEIIGGEHILIKRVKNNEVAKKIINAARGFEEKAFAIGEDIRAINPNPANKAAGISTLEEKALGAIMKSGSSIIEDVLEYGQIAKKSGLYFIDTVPMNEIFVAFAAAGTQLILFQGGTTLTLNIRGSCSAGIVTPISYITGNSQTYEKGKDFIDFNSGPVFDNIEELDSYSDKLLDKILDICSGTMTKVETINYQERIEIYLQDPVF